MAKSISSLWNEYRDEAAVHRAEHYAKFTQPSLMVDPLEKLRGEQATITHDYQSIGSVLLNNLASKLTALLFPGNQPFFKNAITDELIQVAQSRGIPEADIAARLSLLEQEATKNLYMNASFAKLNRAVKLLIVTGQCLIYRDPVARKFRVWSMHSFVVKRDAYGEWSCIVLKQRMLFGDLPMEDRAAYRAQNPGIKDTSDVILYTKILKRPKKLGNVVQVTSELNDKPFGKPAEYPEHLSPWILPIWNLADGEQYARGMVEEYGGDFAKLSVLSEQLGIYELNSLEVINLVDESMGSTVDDLQNAESGDYIPGRQGAVQAHETGDYQKMNSVRQSLSEINSRLAIAFMYTGNTRDAERVTAEEIRAQAKEAENMLGGAYSVLAETLQTPMAYLMMSEVSPTTQAGLVGKQFYPQIVTGIPALNRNVEVQNLISAAQEAALVVPPLVQLDQRIDPKKLLDLFYRSHAVDVKALFKTEAELRKDAATKEAMAQQAAEVAMAADPTTALQQV